MDTASFAVAGVTLVLFVAALFEKGLTHELSLEAGVFLVSIKLMMLAYKSHKSSERVEARLDEIADALKKK
jgi:hypothetical protein